ncbi:DNA modification methylase [candidate division WOR-3 bacterium JGI_Cruoil_03_51_56]|uniref:site-specific DNA-methyltransferase (cytosine-N(4)-specific) n=1 Tax=candidate division WOR-3 bacterium JGI_Cruoil_03_51_56 TaxID=1973747 RepID=A0A235BT53_UNCW3|nr:MAG: DNA modification methylase [candidate division WOR-3 bacterium JGI_Cruoil_03_51_56]
MRVARPPTRSASDPLNRIAELDREMTKRFRAKLIVERFLTRQLVSFQANKQMPFYRWYKFKEGFSAALVDILMNRYGVASGIVLDPFAGVGTTLFAAARRGLDAEGIEVLPIGQEVIRDRLVVERELTPDDERVIKEWAEIKPWRRGARRQPLPELRITAGAYPPDTVAAIEGFLGALARENDRVQAALRLVLLSVLESVSFTRKDGQYLRWDRRSGRRQGVRPFNKGAIADFDEAITLKLSDMLRDVSLQRQPVDLFPAPQRFGDVTLHEESCLTVLPGLKANRYAAIVTSPPYCNRYDYTRTYALELALLGVDETALSALRQAMLTCTVENRAKDLLAISPNWKAPIAAADQLELLQAILAYLEAMKAAGKLNNNSIPRMVRGYFYEMACAIWECCRVLKRGAPMCMVNDNVRYAGVSVSVDLILSSIAEQAGFEVQSIMVLPGGKGNSSQQMGRYGREQLRKCVYVWRKR